MSVADLITSRLLLKQCEEAEFDELYRLWNEAGIRRSLGRTVDLRAASRTGSPGKFAAQEKGWGGIVVDQALARWSRHRFCGFGFADNMEDVPLIYGLRAEQQRTGFALEAARAALTSAFDMPEFSRIYAQTDVENQRSRALLLRLGMRLEKEIRFGERCLVRYVLSKGDFRSVRSSLR
jgi:RimJ/RimL family protein N-acetyltransferase